MNAKLLLDRVADTLDGKEEEQEPLRKVTVRLTPSQIDKLDYIAEKTLNSRTAAAELVIEAAISSVYEEMLVHPFFAKMQTSRHGVDENTAQDIEELARDGELTEERLIDIVSNAPVVQREML